MQCATFEVWYTVTFTNNSEKDYDYTTNSNYYNYGTDKQGDPLAVADLVVDYMSSTMVCDVGNDFKAENIEGVNNKDWTKFDNGTAIDAEYLNNNGYISHKLNDTDADQTYETINNKKLQCLTTNTFAGVKPGETKESTIYASTLLANKDDENVFNNSVEVIALNSRTGRTIKEVDDNRAQISKTYQPGNYIPNSSGEGHQQDDDSVRITITPPTGTTNYTTIYIISAGIGLIVIAGVAFLIKKRFMNK